VSRQPDCIIATRQLRSSSRGAKRLPVTLGGYPRGS
jgi:hypothetical protein